MAEEKKKDIKFDDLSKEAKEELSNGKESEQKEGK